MMATGKGVEGASTHEVVRIDIRVKVQRTKHMRGVAYKDPIKVKSVHFVGAKDWLRLPSEELATAFHDPLIIRHPKGHTVPRLDEAAVEQLSAWTAEILMQNSNAALDSKIGVENGEAQADDEKQQPEEACKIQTSDGAMAKKEVEVVEAAQA